MKFEWVVIAEGFGTNSNGAVTVIGINQRVVFAPILPANTKRGVFAHLSSDGHIDVSQEFEVSLNVTDPTGHAIVAITSPAKFNQTTLIPGVPEGLDIFLEVPLRLSRYGEHRFSLSVTPPGGEMITGIVPLYVVEGPSELPPPQAAAPNATAS